MQHVSQKAVATHLGLSQATVSRALNNDHRISAAVRNRVWEAAHELGYRPSVTLASFASKEHWTNRELRGAPIAVLHGRHEDPREMRDYDSLEAVAAERGFKLEWTFIEGARAFKGLDKRLYQRGCQGILLLPSDLEPDWPARLDLSRFATVSLDMLHWRLPLTVIHHSARRSFMETHRRLRDLGARRIGAALWEPGQHPDHASRIGAFYSSEMEAHGSFDPDSLCQMPFGRRPESERDDFLAWVERFRPEAVILNGNREWGWLREVDPGIPCASAIHSDPPPLDSLILPGYGPDLPTCARLAVEHIERRIRVRRYGVESATVLIGIIGIWREGSWGGRISRA